MKTVNHVRHLTALMVIMGHTVRRDQNLARLTKQKMVKDQNRLKMKTADLAHHLTVIMDTMALGHKKMV
ncbi:MAG: hypothetical protein IJ115_04620 [Erysipelotrichaceae bacterium]|nr:hypothetical protein [Erysipelotrichaceae bacterium]